MKLILELHREQMVHQQYGQATKTEVVKAADINLDGDAQLVAETLRALADTISPAPILPVHIGGVELDGAAIAKALKKYQRQQGGSDQWRYGA